MEEKNRTRLGRAELLGTQERHISEADPSSGWPVVESFGETALRVVFGTDISPAVQRQVRNFMARLEQGPLPGMIETVPSFAAVAVFYDPLQAAEDLAMARRDESVSASGGNEAGVGPIYAAVAERLKLLLESSVEATEVQPRIVEIPVLYGGEYGPDLEGVAAHAGLPPEEVVRIHAEREYPVYMIGFAPGFPYLGGMDERIAAPRLDTPRLSVPAGTVGIAGGQTGVYPMSTPGGWRLIGRTPVALFRPEQTPPSLLRAGDRVRFRPVTAAEYERLSMAEEAEGYIGGMGTEKTEASERQASPERVSGPEKNEASEQPDTPEEIEGCTRPAGPEQTEACERQASPERASGPEKNEACEPPDTPEESEGCTRPAGPERTEACERQAPPERVSGPEKNEACERQASPERVSGPEQNEASEQPDTPEASERGGAVESSPPLACAAASGEMAAMRQPGAASVRSRAKKVEHPDNAADPGPVLTVQKPGLLTTLQDLGRPGYQQYGVTPGGAMDAYALKAANLMAGNAEGEAALEITLGGPTLRFERETLIALTGADLAPSIGGEPLPMWRPVRVRAGAVLEFRTAVTGCRAYLALAGGFGVPEALGSRSTDLRADLGGLEGRALRAGDVLHARTSSAASGAFGPLRAIPPGANFVAAAAHAAHGYIVGRPDWADVPAGGFASPADEAADPAVGSPRPGSNARLPISASQAMGTAASPKHRPPSAASPADRLSPQPSAKAADWREQMPGSLVVRFTRGTHFRQFDEPSRTALLTATFRVEPQSDRMGCRLSGPKLRLSEPLEIISEAIAPGTVQVPTSGDPIVLAADRQTTGGYPRIAQIAAVDLRIVGQLRPGQTLRFVEITLAEAERLHIERERELARLRVAWRLWSKG